MKTVDAPLQFPWRWLLAGVAAYLLFVLATIPAARVIPYLQRSGVSVAGASGTVWSGRAGFVQVRGFSLGPTQWELHPWRLVIGKLGATVHSKSSDGYLDADVAVSLGGEIDIRNLRGTLPLSTFARLPLPGGGVNGWSGTLRLDLAELTLAKQWPTSIDGSVNITSLVGPPRQPSPLGSYKIVFTRDDDISEVRGAVSSLEDAPLDVVGSIRISVDRTYSVDAQVGTRAGAPPSIVKAIEYLGIPDGEGRRPLSIAGSL